MSRKRSPATAPCRECGEDYRFCKDLADKLAGHAAPETAPDMINSPPHYTGIQMVGRVIGECQTDRNGVERVLVQVEAIDIIEALGHGYHVSTALKYLCRMGKKGDGVEDLKKARWFLDRAIERAGK